MLPVLFELTLPGLLALLLAVLAVAGLAVGRAVSSVAAMSRSSVRAD